MAKLTKPFGDLIEALQRKDAGLFDRLRLVPLNVFWREWKEVHPEDFPQGGMSPADASSIKFE
jgi:hypothetical protein